MKNMQTDRNQVALFIDTANCQYVNFEKLWASAGAEGDLVITRAYGDFNRDDLQTAAHKLYVRGVRLIHCPSWPCGSDQLKNAADETLMSDISNLLYTRNDITTFIICSGDGHFIPVILDIKRQGKKAFIMATTQSISGKAREAADKYIRLPRVGMPVSTDIYRALVQVVRSLQKAQRKSAIHSAIVKPKMSKKLGSEFDEKEYRGQDHGRFRKFSEFLEEAETLGWIRLIRQDTEVLVSTVAEVAQAA